MKLKQTLPYKLKRVVPILGLAGASLFTACEKPAEPDPRHDTIYNWTPYNMSTALSPSRIRASADSALVRYVILNYDAEPGIAGFYPVTGLRTVMQGYIDSVSPANQHKVRGGGTLGCIITDPTDSLWLVDFGFKILNPEQTNALYTQRQR